MKGERERENQENAGVFLGSFGKGFLLIVLMYPQGCTNTVLRFCPKNTILQPIGGISFAFFVPRKLLLKGKFQFESTEHSGLVGMGHFLP